MAVVAHQVLVVAADVPVGPPRHELDARVPLTGVSARASLVFEPEIARKPAVRGAGAIDTRETSK